LRAFLAARAAVAMRAGATGSRAIAGERQVEAAAAAREHLRRASAGLGGGAPLEAVAADLREAAGHLSEITGSRVDEAVLDRVFARFCVGK
jgi:tRNA modification GTPase